MRGLLHRGDWLVLAAALLLIPVLYAGFWGGGGHGLEARVWVDGKVWARLDLFRDQEIEVPGVIGVSRLQIRDGEIRFLDSPCSGRQCIRQGWLASGGEVAACLPNRVSVQILGHDPRFDSINF